MYIKVTIDQNEVVDVRSDSSSAEVQKGLVELAKSALDKWFENSKKEATEV